MEETTRREKDTYDERYENERQRRQEQEERKHDPDYEQPRDTREAEIEKVPTLRLSPRLLSLADKLNLASKPKIPEPFCDSAYSTSVRGIKIHKHQILTLSK